MSCDIRASPIPVKTFYGGATKKEFIRQLLKKKQLREKREKEYSLRPLPDVNLYKHCFDERLVWKWFPRQQLALEYCKTKNDKLLCLFAYEKDDGKRKYLVSTHKQFWSRYSAMDTRFHHFYEIIRLTDPCRLYFDIEYLYEFNPNVDGDEILKLFTHIFCCCIFSAFKIKCMPKDVIDLNSSSEKKFSHHLIFHMKNSLFNNNLSCGNFVKDVMESLRLYVQKGVANRFFPISKTLDFKESVDTYLTVDELKNLILQSDSGDIFFCDLSVYTKNRNFRLYLSSKTSKHIPLIISKNNEFLFKKKLTGIERELYKDRNEHFDPDYLRFSDTLVCPGITKHETIDLLTYGEDSTFSCYQIKTNNDKTDSTDKNNFVEGFNVSPYPLLDKFVLDIVKNRGGQGIIRRWMLYKQSGLIIYDIDHNRYCENILRFHKSNHVYYVADLKFSHIYQKCHDPDCSGFRSKEVIIPNEINPLIESTEANVEEFDFSEDEELNELLKNELKDFSFDVGATVQPNRDNSTSNDTDSGVIQSYSTSVEIDSKINSGDIESRILQDDELLLLVPEQMLAVVATEKVDKEDGTNISSTSQERTVDIIDLTLSPNSPDMKEKTSKFTKSDNEFLNFKFDNELDGVYASQPEFRTNTLSDNSNSLFDSYETNVHLTSEDLFNSPSLFTRSKNIHHENNFYDEVQSKKSKNNSSTPILVRMSKPDSINKYKTHAIDSGILTDLLENCDDDSLFQAY